MNLTGDVTIDRFRMQVTPGNVLRVRAVLLAEAERLGVTVEAGGAGGWVGRCGGDPLSLDARDAFNERIAAMLLHCQGHADRLRIAGHALEEVARSYGHTEADIAASYRALA